MLPPLRATLAASLLAVLAFGTLSGAAEPAPGLGDVHAGVLSKASSKNAVLCDFGFGGAWAVRSTYGEHAVHAYGQLRLGCSAEEWFFEAEPPSGVTVEGGAGIYYCSQPGGASVASPVPTCFGPISWYATGETHPCDGAPDRCYALAGHNWGPSWAGRSDTSSLAEGLCTLPPPETPPPAAGPLAVLWALLCVEELAVDESGYESFGEVDTGPDGCVSLCDEAGEIWVKGYTRVTMDPDPDWRLAAKPSTCEPPSASYGGRSFECHGCLPPEIDGLGAATMWCSAIVRFPVDAAPLPPVDTVKEAIETVCEREIGGRPACEPVGSVHAGAEYDL